jgi:hypothetical protein
MFIANASLQVLKEQKDSVVSAVKAVYGTLQDDDVKVCHPEVIRGQEQPCQWIYIRGITTNEIFNRLAAIPGVQRIMA